MPRLFSGYRWFTRLVSRASGRPLAFSSALLVVLLWLASGPLFAFSDTWQLVINTATTIITFLMVFVIQNTQNRDGVALQTKLDELIRSSNAENIFMGIEKLTDKELEELHRHCERSASRSMALLEKAKSERKRRNG